MSNVIISDKSFNCLSQEEKDKIREDYINGDAQTRKILAGIFSEDRLMSKWKTWSEVENDMSYINFKAEFDAIPKWTDPEVRKQIISTIKISELIRKGFGGNPDPEGDEFYVIEPSRNDEDIFFIVSYRETYRFPCFKKKEYAEEFQSYNENIDLLRKYYHYDY